MCFRNGIIDLRSDTVTHPTPEMRAAMSEAEVGDDVFGDDYTVKKLEEMVADMLGFESGLFVASGTMGNLVALLTHCERGAEIIVGDRSHIFLHEVGGMAALGGIHACQVRNQQDGKLALQDIASAIREDDIHHPRTRLICLENSQNACGGMTLTPEYTRSVAELAHRCGLKLHLDGARLANAAAAQHVDLKSLTQGVDSVMFCMSKGLCAPVGSVLCGSRKFIEEARRNRKQVGGGMRQVGVLAAAGIVALKTTAKRLGEDHANARLLADGLRNIPGIILDTNVPPTNMVYYHFAAENQVSEAEFFERLSKRGILAGRRLVTHYWITKEDVSKVVSAFAEEMSNDHQMANDG
ncbi:MAG TPA: low-specificity L-threonine aldolase [Bacteroidota bacterium]|nr:low-specificity L-threonine aldolase [Bacteroidota bacterium]